MPVYKCPKPEIAKNEEIRFNICLQWNPISHALWFLSLFLSMKDLFKIKEVSKQRTEEKTQEIPAPRAE